MREMVKNGGKNCLSHHEICGERLAILVKADAWRLLGAEPAKCLKLIVTAVTARQEPRRRFRV
jgi:hypothetical protein